MKKTDTHDCDITQIPDGPSAKDIYLWALKWMEELKITRGEVKDAMGMAFREWFRGTFVTGFVDKEKMAQFGTAYKVPADITEMPCGCKRSEDGTTIWTIVSEPFEQFARYTTSQVMVHSDCGRTIGEIPTPWVNDLR